MYDALCKDGRVCTRIKTAIQHIQGGPKKVSHYQIIKKLC